jgi:MFS family permease
MAEVVGTRNVFLGITSTLMAMLCGVILSILPFPLGYQSIFLAGFLASLGSVWSVWRLHTGNLTTLSPPVSAPANQRSFQIRRDRNFVRFALGAGTLQLGMFMSAPLFPLYWIGTLHLSDSWISVLASMLTLTSVVGAFGMRAAGQRLNLSAVMGLSSLLFGFYPILTGVLAHPWLLVAVTAFSGTWSGVINVALFSALAELCPPDKRARYIGVYTWLMNIAVFAAPLLGAAFAEVAGVVPALMIAGAFRIIAAILFWRFPFVSWERHAASLASAPA